MGLCVFWASACFFRSSSSSMWASASPSCARGAGVTAPPLPARAASPAQSAPPGGSAGWAAAVEPAPDVVEWDAIYSSINAGETAFKDRGKEKSLLC